IHLVHTIGKPGVWVYGLQPLDMRTVNIPRYFKLLDRAVDTILGPFMEGVTREQMEMRFGRRAAG
ncbi:MAG: hypothetical protein WCP19_12055, partial [Chloroflexota bacterium]